MIIQEHILLAQVGLQCTGLWSHSAITPVSMPEVIPESLGNYIQRPGKMYVVTPAQTDTTPQPVPFPLPLTFVLPVRSSPRWCREGKTTFPDFPKHLHNWRQGNVSCSPHMQKVIALSHPQQ